MKPLLFLLAILAILVYFPYSSMDKKAFIEESPFEVVIKGEVDQVTSLMVEPFTQLKDILNLIPYSPEADLDSLNYNQYLKKNDIITIPKKKEKQCISLNQASLEQLQSLKGIGPTTAQAIIDYRQNQPFLLIEDLLKVKGIGVKKFELIKADICL